MHIFSRNADRQLQSTAAGIGAGWRTYSISQIRHTAGRGCWRPSFYRADYIALQAHSGRQKEPRKIMPDS